jgi:geranylgeranyl reductase family protein
MRVDVVIVGAGPAGCFVGKILAEHGLKVAIVEEHAEVGRPVCCTGIVGLEGLRELGIKPGKWALGKLRGAAIYPPSNNPIRLTRRKVEALVIDRASFDRSLANAATEAGATLLLKTRCVGLSLGSEPSVKIRGGEKNELRARVVIGADGPLSLVARRANLLIRSKYIKCAQVETKADVADDIAEVYLGRSFAPGFFGWMVKAGEVCRVGLGTATGNPKQLLEYFLFQHPVVSRRIEGGVFSQCVGLIPECLSRRIQDGAVLLVGDAAGQIKPLTGGGLYIGLSCAKMAAEAVVGSVESGKLEKLEDYQRAVMDRFGAEFTVGSRLKKFFDQMSDEDLDFLSQLLEREDIRKLVLENFDFDHHEKLFSVFLVKAPEILKSLGIRRALKYVKLLAKP